MVQLYACVYHSLTWVPLTWVPFILFLAGCSAKLEDGIKFVETVQSQSKPIADFSQLTFTDDEGNSVKLADVMKRKYMVLVVTRGWSNAICLYCASQTSKWARRFNELEPYGAELVVIFPTQTEADESKVDELYKKIKTGPIENDEIPFPVLMDINLTTVDQLGIRAELAKPATYIIDRQGRVRFAYVGQTIADRPSVDAILNQLKRMED